MSNNEPSNENVWAAPLTRLALDLGPLVLFFAGFEFFGIYVATGVFMAAILVSLGLGYLHYKRISPMPVFTAVLVLVFGGLTLYLHNDVFIKVKLTVLYAFFGLTLIGGLAFKRLFIKYVFGQALELTEEGWRKLTWRWGFFFLALAVANEIIWRNYPTNIWVDFKVWVIIPLIFLFGLIQAPLVMKHEIETKPDPKI
jgi:intracellular septation protein